MSNSQSQEAILNCEANSEKHSLLEDGPNMELVEMDVSSWTEFAEIEQSLRDEDVENAVSSKKNIVLKDRSFQLWKDILPSEDEGEESKGKSLKKAEEMLEERRQRYESRGCEERGRIYNLEPVFAIFPRSDSATIETGVSHNGQKNFSLTDLIVPTTPTTTPTSSVTPTNATTAATSPTFTTSPTLSPAPPPTTPCTPSMSRTSSFPLPSVRARPAPPRSFLSPTSSITMSITPIPTHSPSPSSPSPAQMNAGLNGVVATETRISMVDGLNGVLLIGGYPVEEIAGHISLEEAAALLWTGDLPSSTAAAKEMQRELANYRSIRAETLAVIRGAVNAPPIDALRMACATLSLSLDLDLDVTDPNDISPAADLRLAKRLLSCFPTVVAAHSRLRQGLEPIAPRSDLGLAANFLYMMCGTEVSPLAVQALETYWVTVCDHGMNASTFTARVIASTRSDMVSAVTGAVGALKGPLHGGAPGPVLDMLIEMKTADAAETWLRRELTEGRRIMGFGHRIYKVRDPRAEVLARAAEKMAGVSAQSNALYRLARSVEGTALKVLEELKPGRNLKTNVEFYTALVMQSMGLKPDQFVAVFACGRVAGWCAHVMEQHKQDRLLRPQSQYIGSKRSWSRQRESEEV